MPLRTTTTIVKLTPLKYHIRVQFLHQTNTIYLGRLTTNIRTLTQHLSTHLLQIRSPTRNLIVTDKFTLSLRFRFLRRKH